VTDEHDFRIRLELLAEGLEEENERIGVLFDAPGGERLDDRGRGGLE
jgi:hypothetical protein